MKNDIKRYEQAMDALRTGKAVLEAPQASWLARCLRHMLPAGDRTAAKQASLAAPHAAGSTAEPTFMNVWLVSPAEAAAPTKPLVSSEDTAAAATQPARRKPVEFEEPPLPGVPDQPAVPPVPGHNIVINAQDGLTPVYHSVQAARRATPRS